jgi:head-tail adaptor
VWHGLFDSPHPHTPSPQKTEKKNEKQAIKKMISAGLLTKNIVIQRLKIERDDYGSDIEKWIDIHVCKANVKGFDSAALTTQNDEILIQDRLLFSIRKSLKLLIDKPNHYRILYNFKTYNILALNDEDRDTIKILGVLRND